MKTEETPRASDSLLRTYELAWENHQPGHDLFPDGLDSDETLLFHGTASTREEMIDRNGLLPHAAGVAVENVCFLVECFELLGWNGSRTAGYPVLRSYTLKNDFRDSELSPLYLSERPSQAICFAVPATAGGEKISACRFAIADLRRFLTDAEFREREKASPDNWNRPEAANAVSAAMLIDVGQRFSSLLGLERQAQEERDRYKYAVIYAIRPPADARSAWEDCRGMGWRVYDAIPPSWFVAKLRVYPPKN